MSTGGLNPRGSVTPDHPVMFRRSVQGEQEEERRRADGRREPAGRLQSLFAMVGVGAGFVAFVVPGIALRRRVRAWNAGDEPTPGMAGPLGAVVTWVVVALVVASFTAVDFPVYAFALVGLLPSLVVSARG